MMSAYQKYNFEPIINGKIQDNPSLRKHRITEADVLIAEDEGFRKGEASAMVIAQKQTADAVKSVANLIQIILGNLNTLAFELKDEAVELSMASAKAIAGSAIDENLEIKVKDFIKEAVTNLRDTPKISIGLNENTINSIRPILEQTAKDAGFEGRIEFRATENPNGDCSIVWGNGSIHKNRAQTIEKINEKAKNWLNSAQDEDIQFNLFD